MPHFLAVFSKQSGFFASLVVTFLLVFIKRIIFASLILTFLAALVLFSSLPLKSPLVLNSASPLQLSGVSDVNGVYRPVPDPTQESGRVHVLEYGILHLGALEMYDFRCLCRLRVKRTEEGRLFGYPPSRFRLAHRLLPFPVSARASSGPLMNFIFDLRGGGGGGLSFLFRFTSLRQHNRTLS